MEAMRLTTVVGLITNSISSFIVYTAADTLNIIAGWNVNLTIEL